MVINVTVHRPELTERERAQRIDAIKRAAVELVIANERRKKATRA